MSLLSVSLMGYAPSLAPLPPVAMARSSAVFMGVETMCAAAATDEPLGQGQPPETAR